MDLCLVENSYILSTLSFQCSMLWPMNFFLLLYFCDFQLIAAECVTVAVATTTTVAVVGMLQ